MTRLLIDAHALLWWLGGDERLSAGAREAIEAAEAPLVEARRSRAPGSVRSMLAAQALTERIPVVTRDAALLAYGVASLW